MKVVVMVYKNQPEKSPIFHSVVALVVQTARFNFHSRISTDNKKGRFIDKI
jgi:hypothetical protein